MEFAIGFHFPDVTSLIRGNVNQQLELGVVYALTLDVTITLLESDAKAVSDTCGPTSPPNAILILEAIQWRDECKKVCEIMGDTPVLFNMVPGAGSPDLAFEEAGGLGFRLTIFPGVFFSMC
jgi:hypothetical protein